MVENSVRKSPASHQQDGGDVPSDGDLSDGVAVHERLVVAVGSGETGKVQLLVLQDCRRKVISCLHGTRGSEGRRTLALLGYHALCARRHWHGPNIVVRFLILGTSCSRLDDIHRSSINLSIRRRCSTVPQSADRSESGNGQVGERTNGQSRRHRSGPLCA